MRPLTVLWISAFVTASAGQAATLYGITLGNRTLITINTTTGVGTAIATTGLLTTGAELGSTGGNLYAFDRYSADGSLDLFARVNPANASVFSTTTAGADIDGEAGLTFRPDGLAFLSDSSGLALFLCDVTVINGCSLVTSLSVSMDGLAVASNGTLYGLSHGTSQLYTINTSTGASTQVGLSGVVNTGVVGGLTFAPDGTLYAAFDDRLWTFDTGTGAATLIGATGFGDDVAGIAFLDVDIPEPGTLLLLGGALAALLAKRRWNRA